MRARDYPHQFSGGMRQRAMIAMALVHNPDVLIADEPTTALDVTVQAQILELIDRVKKEFDVGVILITHDLGVVAETATHVMVMYAGRAMEYGAGARDLQRARSTRTRGACSSRCRRSRSGSTCWCRSRARRRRCSTRRRAARSTRAASTASSRATSKRPPLAPIPGGHLDACHLPAERKREIWANRDRRRARRRRERREPQRRASRRAHGAARRGRAPDEALPGQAGRVRARRRASSTRSRTSR